MKAEYDFIVNPKSRSGMGWKVWKSVEPQLKQQRINYCLHLTEKKGHAAMIAGKVTADGKEHIIVVLGGDGTVNEVVNGICVPERVLLGYIPIGSSNDFARGLGIPKDPGKALQIVLHPGRIREIDIGVIERSGKKRKFAVSAGIGFDAAVCHEVCISRWKVMLNKLKLGKLSYAMVALDRLMKDRPVRFTAVTENGEKKVFEKTYFAAFMNLQYEGGGFRFCPKASCTDGLLDVIVVHDLPVMKILLLLPTAFAGWHTRFWGVSVFRCRKAVIDTEIPLPIHTDGEPAFPRKNISAWITGEKIRVIVE